MKVCFDLNSWLFSNSGCHKSGICAQNMTMTGIRMQNRAMLWKWIGFLLKMNDIPQFWFKENKSIKIFVVLASSYAYPNVQNSYIYWNVCTLVTGRVSKMLISTFVPMLGTQCQLWATSKVCNRVYLCIKSVIHNSNV